MTDTVLAVCPGCNEQLRIPSAWADKAVKCKKCGSVVRASQNPAPAHTPYTPAPIPGYQYPVPAAYPAPPGYTPPMVVIPAAVPVGNAFEQLEEKKGNKKRKQYKKGGSGLLYVVIGVGLVGLFGGALALMIFKDQISASFNPKPTNQTPSTGKGSGEVRSGTTASAPRRLLALSVTKYLYCNPLIGGKSTNGASEFNEAIRTLAFRWEVPEGKDNNQVFVVTDSDARIAANSANRPMLKSVLMDSVSKFCETSRAQDHIVIYFGGHAYAKEGKAYLVPMEGDLAEPETLIPLTDFWAKLQACPAQQKIVLFDVCRISTDDNAVRPGSEPMTEELDKLLHTAPAGVQVLTSCSTGQNAYEYRGAPDADTPSGSAFLGALRAVARKTKDKLGANDPLPVEAWASATGVRLADSLGKARPSTPKASGSKVANVEANAEEAVAARWEYPTLPAGADVKDVQAAFTALDTPPLIGIDGQRETLENVLFFQAETMNAYKPDVGTDEVLANPDKYKTRLAALKALTDIRDGWNKVAPPDRDSILRDGLGQAVDDVLKKTVEREQDPLAKLSNKLTDIVETLEELKAEAEKDTSKYWKAMFNFALAQAKLRVAFVEEANTALGKVRLNDIEGADRGIRLVQVPKMKNRKVATEAKQAQELLDALAKEAKGTPWEVVAKQWRSVSLGLEWRAKEKNADTTATEEKK
jgi:Caspase domain